MNKKYGLIAGCIILISLVFALVVAGVTKLSDNTSPSEIVSGEATLQAQEGNYSVKITTVLEAEPNTDDADPPKAERVAIVVYEYTNADITHGLAIGNTHFKAYDANGKELLQYPQKDLFVPSEVGESGTFTASVAFALNNDKNYLKIEYYNDVSAKTPDAVFEQEW